MKRIETVEELYKVAEKKRACEEGLEWLEEQTSLECLNTQESIRLGYWKWCVRHSPGMDYILEKVNANLLNSYDAYLYCLSIKDIKSVRDKITESYYAYRYCREIKDIKSVRDRITDSYYAYRYCREIEDKEEIRDKITDSDDAYLYCLDIRDIKSVRERIKK